MKILIITAELASSLVKAASLKSHHDVGVHVVETPIAAFLTPKRIIRELQKIPEQELQSVDMIITPGLIRKDVSPVYEEMGIPTYKGSTDASDLDIVLEMVDKLDLS
ncbi:MAG: dihydropteroate synthase-like protein, partial [Methanobacteriaceae archaeon]|nr:dihydropteroate synthase-like protein [Methanobacteriaceae archaeon]